MPATQETKKDPVIVVLQLTGGNDYVNTAIPYNNPLYRDNRKAVGIPDDQIMHLDGQYGIPPYMAPLKQFWDDKKLAILHGVGWKESPRSHFRAMDIWHTCEPVKVGTEGWLGRVAREFDPKKENVVTTVSFGPSLPRALAVPGVPVACVGGPLENYGFLPTIQGNQRKQILERFAAMYKPAIGTGAVMDYMADTGIDSLKGEDILKVAPQRYSSTVQYPNTSIARKLKGIAQVHFADLGTRIFYCDRCRAGNVFKSRSIVDAAVPVLARGCCDSERNGVRSVAYVAELQFYIIGRPTKHDIPQGSGWPTRRSGDYFPISYWRAFSRSALPEPSTAASVGSSIGNTGVARARDRVTDIYRIGWPSDG